MLRKSVFLLMTVGLGMSFAAENLLVLKIGPTWPKALQWSKKPTAWDASVQGGWVFDRKLAFGGGIDFLWNVNKQTTPISGGGTSYRIENVQKSFMFPISGFLALTPIPDFRVHPCASVQIGLNTLYYSNSADSVLATALRESGWYMGFYCKLAADAVLNLGDKSGLFAGVEYQWATADKLNPGASDILTQRKMGAFGLRMGFRVLY